MTFNDKTFPTLIQVKAEDEELLSDKLMVTLGGRGDFESLGLAKADFDNFDLQDLFC